MADIEDLVQNVMDNNFNKANDVFNALIQDKMGDALDQEKIAVSSQIFGNDTEETETLEVEGEEDDDMDFGDINLDDIDLDDFDIDDIDLDDIDLDDFNLEDEEG